MKTLVVYYSKDGHTKNVAEEISVAIGGSDLFEITEPQSRAGFLGWLLACRDAALKKDTAIDTSSIDPTGYDFVIIGTPVWAFTMPSAVRSWLNKYGKSLNSIIFFATMGGNGDRRTFSHMEEVCAKHPLLTATFIDKEISNGAHKQKLAVFIDKVKRLLEPL